MSLISKEHLNIAMKSVKKLLTQKADKSELELKADKLQEEISKVSEKIAQPDWNQNDENSPAYIKNRTHHDRVEVILVDNFASDITPDTIPNCTLIEGEKYKIIWNGVEHEHICVSDGYFTFIETAEYALENDDSDENSLIVYTTNANWTISIIHIKEEIRQLDEKYIPDTIVRVKDIPEQIQPDWNQNDETAKDYVKNRTHYSANLRKTIDFVQTGQTGFEVTVSSDMYELLKNNYHIAKYYVDNNEYSYIHTTFDSTGNENYVFHGTETPDSFIARGYIKFRENNIIYLYFDAYPNKASIVIDIPEIHQLDPKYLPDSVLAKPNWNQDNPDGDGYILNRTHYDTRVVLSEVLPETKIDFGANTTIRWRGSDTNYFVLTAGKTYEVMFDGTPYYCVCNSLFGNNYITGIGNQSIQNSNNENTGEPFFIQWEDYYDGALNYLYVSTSGEHTITIQEIASGKFKQLDEKYIPNTIARSNDIEEIEESLSVIKTNTDTIKTNTDTVAFNLNNLSKKVLNKMEYHTSVTTSPINSNWLSDIVYGDGKFVIVGGNAGVRSNYTAYSTDGVNWNKSDNFDDEEFSSIAYGNGKFIATSSYRRGYIYYSTNGYNWSKANLPYSTSWRSIAYGDGRFVVIDEVNGYVAWSSEGIDWVSTSSIQRGTSITYGNGKFVAVSLNGSAYYSTDGTTWDRVNLLNSGTYKHVTFGMGRFVVVNDSNQKAAYSDDGVNWNEITMPHSSYTSIIYADDKFIAIGYDTGSYSSFLSINSYLDYSFDGINWESVTMPTYNFKAIAYGNGKFIAIETEEGKIFSSMDCISWSDSIYQNSINITNEIKELILSQLNEKYIPDSIARTSDIPEDYIPIPETVEIGQIIQVSTVDENGKPTGWEAVDPFVLTDESTGIKYKLSIIDAKLTMTEVSE